jgi:hypothetical protein
MIGIIGTRRKDIEKKIELMNFRVNFWEKMGRIPTEEDLALRNMN